MHTKVEYIADFDVIKAGSIDISEKGMRFEVREPLVFDMQFEWQGKIYHHRAQLGWAKRKQGTRAQFGVEFVNAEDEVLF